MDEAEKFPRELYRKAAAIGLLGLGYPEEYGGTPADVFYSLVASDELARAGSGGVSASLLSHSIADAIGLALRLRVGGEFVTSGHHKLDMVAAAGVCPISFFR